MAFLAVYAELGVRGFATYLLGRNVRTQKGNADKGAAIPLVDSTGIFAVGPCDGAKLAYDLTDIGLQYCRTYSRIYPRTLVVRHEW